MYAQDAGRGVTLEPSEDVDELHRAVAHALESLKHGDAAGHAHGVVLAVSGGRDSMVLLHAAVAVARPVVRAVAAFDHGTGPHATAAVALVRAAAESLGLPFLSETAPHAGRNESEWRDARWRFLLVAAAAVGASAVATAHTRDDQLETVVMRLLRGAGTRGLASLAARTTTVVRPLLSQTRAQVAAYADAHDVRWLEDPSNADRRHLRVRLRLDLLPAIDRVCPGTSTGLLDVAAHAATWRDKAERWAGAHALDDASEGGDSSAAAGRRLDRSLSVRVSDLAGHGPDALAVFWPAFAAGAGVRLDRRAISRLVSYTAHAVQRVREGTVQPARVPVAGTTAAPDGVANARLVLACAPDPAAGGRRTWQLSVRASGAPGALGDGSGRAAGVAVPGSSDYA